MLAEEIYYDEEDRLLVTDDVLRDKLVQFSDLSHVDPWIAEQSERYGIALNEAAIAEAAANLLPVPALKPPVPREGWEPSDVAVATSNAGIELSLSEFVEFHPILGWLDWPRVRNVVSMRSVAVRLLLTKILHDRYRKGEYALDLKLESAALAERDLAVGRAHLDRLYADIDVTEELAATIYEENDEAFTTPESISLAALGVSELEHADELFAALSDGSMTLAQAAEAALSRDPERVYVPHMPFLARGSFPDTDAFFFGLEEGAFADPLPTSSGYMIYQVLKKRPPRKLRRVEMSDETFQRRVWEVVASGRMTAEVARIREQLDVVEHEAEVRQAIEEH